MYLPSFLFLDILLVGMISFQWCHFAHFKLDAGGVSGITGWLKDFQCMPEAVLRQSSMSNLSLCKLVVSTFSARELKHKCDGHDKNGSWQFVGKLVKSALHQQIKFVLDSSCVEPNKVWASLKPNVGLGFSFSRWGVSRFMGPVYSCTSMVQFWLWIILEEHSASGS